MKLTDAQKQTLNRYLKHIGKLECEAKNIIKLILTSASDQPTSASLSLSETDEKSSKEILELKKLVNASKSLETAESRANACLLACCYEFGIGLAKDCKQALELYLSLAAKEDVFALTSLGYIYRAGEGVTKDEKKAFDYFNQAAQKNYAKAQCFLGECYEEGLGCTKDIKLAVKCYQLAADQRDSQAQNNLGELYREAAFANLELEHLSGDKNIALARHYYMLAAAQDHRGAQNNLGCSYSDGSGSVDHAVAFTYFLRAAQDPDLTVAHTHLADCYYKGKGTPINLGLAAKHYLIAASHEQCDPEALIGLGGMCTEGAGDHPPNLDQAMRYYKQAWEAGYPEGLYGLGWCLRKRGDEKSMLQAVEYFKEGAKQDDILCLTALGEYYESPLPLNKPFGAMYEAAAAEYSKVVKLAALPSALLGTKIDAQRAQVLLADLLLKCKVVWRGIETDRKQAYDLCITAANSGNETAKYMLTQFTVGPRRRYKQPQPAEPIVRKVRYVQRASS